MRMLITLDAAAFSYFARTSIYKAASEQRQSCQLLQQQEHLHQLCQRQGLQAHSYSTLPGPVGTFTLIYDTLDEAIATGLIKDSDAAALEPSLFLILPRLAIVQGVVGARLPESAEAFKVPFEAFTPHLCRTIPIEALAALRSLPSSDLKTLKRVLAGMEPPRQVWQTDLFRSICAAADQVSRGQGAEWAEMLQRGMPARCIFVGHVAQY